MADFLQMTGTLVDSGSMRRAAYTSIMVGITMFAASSGHAATLTTLATFGGSNGANSYAGLIADAAHNLYGTTAYGGASNAGTVFKLSAGGTLTTLASFDIFNTGSSSFAGLIADAAGNFYGTTAYNSTSGAGTVFKLSAGGTLTTLARFEYGTYGGYPRAGLIADAAGNLYGTTTSSGASGVGTVFGLSPSGTLTTLASFDGTNGARSGAGLIADAAGNFYGTTYFGGSSDYGTVFKLSGSGTLTTLANFDGTNGADSYSGLIADAAGNFYGTTYYGGSSNLGTVFKLSASGTLTTLASFDRTNGAYSYAGLIADAAGNLYGTTVEGGTSNYGTVFKLSASGTLTTLASFSGTNGAYSYAGLIADAAGNLYGTTLQGGLSDYGTVFKLSDTGFAVPSVAAVLEPASWAMMIAGFGLIGAVARRQRQTATA